MAKSKFHTLEAYETGEIADNPNYTALGRTGRDLIREPETAEMIPAPYGTEFFFLPGRDPMGLKKGKKEHYFMSSGEKVTAVALIPPSGYTRTLLPAYNLKKKEELPFFAYTMGALKDEEIYIAAVQTDSSLRWDPSQYSSPDLKNKIKKKLKKYPDNKLLRHLAKCAVDYSCYNAQNIFYERWEGGIPTSPVCNANCTGCISKKRKKGQPSPQARINFSPSTQEIVEVACDHLQMGRAIISFGQGCEGEPLLQADLIAESIEKIRQRTDRGTIHINTNGSLPAQVENLVKAGLDSIRISMNSAVEETYNSFFQPSSFRFKDVKESIKKAKGEGIFVSINYLTMPGINDNEYETGKFIEFLDVYKPDMIQMRNLNIDPDSFFDKMPTLRGKSLGIINLLSLFRERYGDSIIIGNFNRALKD